MTTNTVTVPLYHLEHLIDSLTQFAGPDQRNLNDDEIEALNHIAQLVIDKRNELATIPVRIADLDHILTAYAYDTDTDTDRIQRLLDARNTGQALLLESRNQ